MRLCFAFAINDHIMLRIDIQVINTNPDPLLLTNIFARFDLMKFKICRYTTSTGRYYYESVPFFGEIEKTA